MMLKSGLDLRSVLNMKVLILSPIACALSSDVQWNPRSQQQRSIIKLNEYNPFDIIINYIDGTYTLYFLH